MKKKGKRMDVIGFKTTHNSKSKKRNKSWDYSPKILIHPLPNGVLVSNDYKLYIKITNKGE